MFANYEYRSKILHILFYGPPKQNFNFDSLQFMLTQLRYIFDYIYLTRFFRKLWKQMATIKTLSSARNLSKTFRQILLLRPRNHETRDHRAMNSALWICEVNLTEEGERRVSGAL